MEGSAGGAFSTLVCGGLNGKLGNEELNAFTPIPIRIPLWELAEKAAAAALIAISGFKLAFGIGVLDWEGESKKEISNFQINKGKIMQRLNSGIIINNNITVLSWAALQFVSHSFATTV